MKVGDYVRTEAGEIGKITYFEGDMVRVDCDKFITYKSNHNEITKINPKIINLIEAGDYVNGRKVYQVGYNFQDDLVLKMSIDKNGNPDNYDDFIYEDEIETIVTKEQFENMEYKVED